MQIRYTGPLADGVEVDDPETGVPISAPRMQWVDLPTDVARSLAKQDVWELAGPVKAARTRKRRAGMPEAEAPEPQTDEAPDETATAADSEEQG